VNICLKHFVKVSANEMKKVKNRHCTVCAIDIACAHRGKSDVRRHVGTKNHIDLAKVKQNCRSMKTFISSPDMTNSEIDLRKAVTKSETIMA
jgi:hypothetical protein